MPCGKSDDRHAALRGRLNAPEGGSRVGPRRTWLRAVLDLQSCDDEHLFDTLLCSDAAAAP